MDPYDSLCNIPSHAVLSTFLTVPNASRKSGPKGQEKGPTLATWFRVQGD